MTEKIVWSLLIPPNVQPDDKLKKTPSGGVPVLAEIIRNSNSNSNSITSDSRKQINTILGGLCVRITVCFFFFFFFFFVLFFSHFILLLCFLFSFYKFVI